jgi:hypothetical protein
VAGEGAVDAKDSRVDGDPHADDAGLRQTHCVEDIRFAVKNCIESDAYGGAIFFDQLLRRPQDERKDLQAPYPASGIAVRKDRLASTKRRTIRSSNQACELSLAPKHRFCHPMLCLPMKGRSCSNDNPIILS